MASDIPDISLNNGISIPQVGLGVFQIPPDQTRAATALAIELGYRHIDTAQLYGNEAGVGEAVRESGIDRSEFFVTSKLNNGAHAYADALAAFDQTLATLDIGYLDLFLIHWPLPTIGDFVETWRAMEEIYRGGKVRAIGVSNFQTHHLDRILTECTIVPAVNQIEVNPHLTNEKVRSYDVEHGIATEAWSPIARGRVLDEPAIVAIAQRVGRSPAQVTLRWHVQRGDIIFPKSVHAVRLRENLELFDFELTDDDLAAISALNRDQRTGPDPDAFARLPS
ncbi:aldo/keto reductase [Microlunatus phosphovorus NM-1]|uniref:Aldo/keto reductase n=1 Tax=Microlunatus phosphovorus (strain ATCC 700054 / DSM 10555 / JCM 9379 / NBRC 101784 / NCIMB 13414 / VKM Ac-1990 / NM-1) TaxID=1032480 RepID=F5XGQ7_MICPN|nr:aldo/keto reductase [Microlunatus phosphovorus]BAK35539.1 aldo/keto reductase [Microlunatus phosphovorus NM-1]